MKHSSHFTTPHYLLTNYTSHTHPCDGIHHNSPLLFPFSISFSSTVLPQRKKRFFSFFLETQLKKEKKKKKKKGGGKTRKKKKKKNKGEKKTGT
jgi:hypothetical protein